MDYFYSMIISRRQKVNFTKSICYNIFLGYIWYMAIAIETFMLQALLLLVFSAPVLIKIGNVANIKYYRGF